LRHMARVQPVLVSHIYARDGVYYSGYCWWPES
jgi:hypothetical protein